MALTDQQTQNLAELQAYLIVLQNSDMQPFKFGKISVTKDSLMASTQASIDKLTNLQNS